LIHVPSDNIEWDAISQILLGTDNNPSFSDKLASSYPRYF